MTQRRANQTPARRSKQPSARRTKQASRRRNAHQMRYALFLLVLVAGLFIAARLHLSRQEKEQAGALPAKSELLRVATAPGLDEEIVEYRGMTVSFNPHLHIPNWVAWELTAEEAAAEDAKRSNDFRPDPDVEGCPTVDSYRNSGYDKGHMAPAGDMKWDAEAMSQTFLLTNIVPQAGELNRGAWKKVEEKCRARAARDSAVYIVCGPVLTDPLVETIGPDRVAVPSRFFKVILSPYAEHPTAIAFVMDNGRVEGGMQRAAVSIDDVEALTGHDFFTALDDATETVLERQCNFNAWSRLR